MVGELLVEDHLLEGGGAHAAVLTGPGWREPVALAELAHELACKGGLVFVIEEVIVALEVVRDLGFEEGDELLAPAFGFG